MELSAEQLAKILAATESGSRPKVRTQPAATRRPTTGDVFVFPLDTEIDVRWVFLTDTGADRSSVLVPADGNHTVGSNDVEFIVEDTREYLVARCRYVLPVEREQLGKASRVARVPKRDVHRIRERLDRQPSLFELLEEDRVESDPAYTDWCAAVRDAVQSLRDLLATITSSELQSPAQTPTKTSPRTHMTLSPWREIAIPRPDVLKGTFRQSEFAADITAVNSGKAPPEYQDAAEFFDRTYITEGMRNLLVQVAQRLSGKDGDPVIQLQTAFGGGKTHTMLAVWHLATRKCKLKDLSGIPTLVEKAGLMDIPQARVAVIDGTAHAPGQPWKHGRTIVKTLWGELAWQLGESEGFALVKEADATGTSPGKDKLRELLEKYSPCVVLMDELVAYIRQFADSETLSGGTFGSNLSFVQALTEAAKLVPTAVVLASLPESDPASDKSNAQVGGARGLAALRALEDIFGRVQALWKPVGTEESFEIVRRRLFDPIKSVKARDAVCRAFADTYMEEGAKLPSETQEGRYYDRLCQAYPIHPEVFDRLYEDWTTIDGFQRTRGVLKLMAKVISRLWKDNNADLMIMPGSLPLYVSDVRNEMTYLLPPGWDPVIEGEIDGDRAETTDLEIKERRFGQVNAARRVARTLFLGTAPSSVSIKQGTRGQDRGRVLLGCVQPGQTAAVYSDALDRLTDRLHFLNSIGEKSDPKTRYWFDTRANLRREMEDRKQRFDEATDVRKKIEDTAKKLFNSAALFDAVHVFAPPADVPDDSVLRLVVLSPDQYYLKDAPRLATDSALEYLRSHGTQPRHRANRLLFVAADQPTLNRLKDAARTAMAWASIVDDVDEGRLNIDQNQRKQAEKESRAAAEVLPRAARECFRWLLSPVQDDPHAEKPTVEAFPLNTSAKTVSDELDRVCKENELVIQEWSPTHLRTHLKQLYWKPDRHAVGAIAFWEDTLRYLYLPRLKNRDVLIAAIRSGVLNRDFFGTAYGQTGGKYDGFQFGAGPVSVNDTLLLIEPEAATVYEDAQKKPVVTPTPDTERPSDTPVGTGGAVPLVAGKESSGGAPVPTPKAKTFTGAVSVPAATARMKLIQIAEDIVAQLLNDPNATVRVTVEISADFATGVSDAIKRIVSENATSLGFNTKEWE